MSTAITRAPRPFATRMPAPPIGPIPNMATVSVPEIPNRRWASNCVPTMSVITAPASKLSLIGEREAVTRGHDHEVGIAAINVEANALPRWAEEEIAMAAIFAGATADTEIDRNTVPRSDGSDSVTDRDDFAGGLVARHDLAGRGRLAANDWLPVIEAHVASADCRGAHSNQRLAGTRLWGRSLDDSDLAVAWEEHGFHSCRPPFSTARRLT